MRRFQSKRVNDAARWLLLVLGVGLGGLLFLIEDEHLQASLVLWPYIAVVLALGVVAVVTQPRGKRTTHL